MSELKSWREMPIGSMITTPGSSIQYKTGSWRTFKPIVNREKCTRCMICFVFCPEPAISPEIEVNYDYCKGCGICAKECPVKAIEMVEEEI